MAWNQGTILVHVLTGASTRFIVMDGGGGSSNGMPQVLPVKDDGLMDELICRKCTRGGGVVCGGGGAVVVIIDDGDRSGWPQLGGRGNRCRMKM